MKFDITLISREGKSTHTVEASEVTEKLRQIGLEWKIADWPHDQHVCIIVGPAQTEPEGAESID